MMRMNQVEEQKLPFRARRQLKRVGLADCMYQEASSLTLNQQRILEVARTLCCNPALLLSDRSAAGLHYEEKRALAALLTKLKAKDMSVLLVEYDMNFVVDLTSRPVVIEFSTKVAEGLPQEVQQNPAVLEAYLGDVE